MRDPEHKDEGTKLDQIQHLLSGHLLGPLVTEYETQIELQSEEIKGLKFFLKKQLEREKDIFNENEKLAQELEVKQREYLKLLQETRDNVDLLAMVSDGGKVGETEGYKAMKERIHLLTEENHILFEQVTLLRVHHDAVTKECTEKLHEASTKISQFDNVMADLTQTSRERDELIRANSFLETKLTEVTQMLSSMEEGRRTDSVEVKKMREQVLLFHKEYNFYKDMAQKLDLRQSEDLDALNFALREADEKLKDQGARIADLERENLQLVT